MKKINPSRWKKPNPEEIDFEAEPIIGDRIETKQGNEVKKIADKTRTSGHTPLPQHYIIIPQKRIRIRHAFEIYEDQLEAFKKLQAAYRDTHNDNKILSLSDIAREAFDKEIAERVKETKNIEISYE